MKFKNKRAPQTKKCRGQKVQKKRPQKCGPRPVCCCVHDNSKKRPKSQVFRGINRTRHENTSSVCLPARSCTHVLRRLTCCDTSCADMPHMLQGLARGTPLHPAAPILSSIAKAVVPEWYPSSCATGCTTILPKTVRYGLVNRMSAACGMTGLMSALLLISSLELIKRWCVTVDEVELHVRG